jgi:polyphosphate glucokinase
MPKKAAKPIPTVKTPRTLAIDIGGSGIKAVVLDADGKVVKERVRLPTPRKATPNKLIAAVRGLVKQQDGFERVSVGFPGVVKDGFVYSAANLGRGWIGFDLAKGLGRKLKRPVRVANDADVQGLGSASGRGLELVVTLGTGFGSVLFSDGRRIHLELAHHPFHKGKTYEDELGRRALDRKGRKKWNKLLAEAIDDLRQTFNYDRLYIGGGDAKFVTLKLPPDAQIISNEAGLLGGIALWKEAPKRLARPAAQAKRTVAVAKPAVGAKPAVAAPKRKTKRRTKAPIVALPPVRPEPAADQGSDAAAQS